jgi:hypothetical protein
MSAPAGRFCRRTVSKGLPVPTLGGGVRVSDQASALRCPRRLLAGACARPGPSERSPRPAAPFPSPKPANPEGAPGLLAAASRVLVATGRTPSGGMQRPKGHVVANVLPAGGASDEITLSDRLVAASVPPRRLAGLGADVPAHNGWGREHRRGLTSSHRFTAQSGPMVLSYGLTVMSSCSL